MDQINRIFQPEYICIEDSILTKNEGLKKLSKMGAKAGILENQIDVYNELLERESEFSTGFGDGFAIPHAKSKFITTPGVFVIKSTNLIEWEAIDDKPVNILIGLLVPYESRGDIHLSLLAKLSENLMEDEFKQKLQESITEKQIYELIHDVLKN